MDEDTYRKSDPVVAGLPAEPEPPLEGPITSGPRRDAMDMVPGVPAGADEALDEVLRTPDRDIGGAVAGDTTPRGKTGDEPTPDQVKEDDRKRTTL